ncbi:MAG: DEAD/DEAH box helicase family protein [Chloroflexi bacterium]|nr:DEAD/DEAH box helicase family protein [Chloroflexota bacterium]
MLSPSEAKTRRDKIDPQVSKAGWNLANRSRVKFEIPVDGEDAEPWNGITDYALCRENGEVIAIVEAKRTTHDPRLAQQQAEHYITEIAKHQSFRPYAFLANGIDTYFWDSEFAPKRLVAGFFSPDDLERLLFIRQNGSALVYSPINSTITDRSYQHEAIRRIAEAFDRGKRKALLVMATGTGKTRTVVSLVDLFLRAKQAQKVLFLADRDALVKQALTDGFKTFLPDEPRGRVYAHTVEAEKTKRLFAGTLQALSNCFQQFTPSFFDLIIFDEVHRSIFNKYEEIIEYFDAKMIGLTATPAQFIDRNTFLVFDCGDGKPTFLYTYEEAIRDGFLVPFDLYGARTRFQRKGIKGVDLSEEDRNAIIELGLDPDDIDFEGTDLEKKVSNKDTLRKQWEEIWEVCLKDESGHLPGKTIVFAMTQKHALRLQDAFEKMFPHFPHLSRVVTHESEYRGQLVEGFKKQDMPRIAISVDMLDTGIDVPEAVNLVFMKPVQSQIKLQQMVGRGTRNHATCRMYHLLPDGRKTGFLIIDFWENDFNRQADDSVAPSMPVLVTIFNTRLKLLELDLDSRASREFERTVGDLRAQIAQIPRDSFLVRRSLADVEEVDREAFWLHLTSKNIDFLRNRVGPLLRYASAGDVEGATFISKVERLKWQKRAEKDPGATMESIAGDVSRLPDFVVNDPALRPSVEVGASPGRLAEATTDELNRLADDLAPQMRNRREETNAFLLLDLPDTIDVRGYILLHGGKEQVYVEEYRERVEKRIRELVENHPAIQAIQRDEPVDDWELIDLERTLRVELGGGEVELTEANIRKAYGLKVGSLLSFLRAVLGIEGLPDYDEVVRHLFQAFISQHEYNADQINFLRVVQNVFIQKRRLERMDLYEDPLTRFGDDAVDRWFTARDVDEVLDFAERLVA